MRRVEKQISEVTIYGCDICGGECPPQTITTCAYCGREVCPKTSCSTLMCNDLFETYYYCEPGKTDRNTVCMKCHEKFRELDMDGKMQSIHMKMSDLADESDKLRSQFMEAVRIP